MSNEQQILDVLSRMAQKFEPAAMAPVMKEIGEDLVMSTKQRFSTSTDPEGVRWAPLKPGTVLARLAKMRGVVSKKGKLTKKGAAAVMGMKPLVDSGITQLTMLYQVVHGGAGVQVGTNRFADEWDGGMAVHQHGSRDGRIPARRFVGLSREDEATVLGTLMRFWEELL